MGDSFAGPAKDAIMANLQKYAHIYVVGNGPSLRDFDFQHLRTRSWIGMNAAYRHWERIDHYPPYYACLDTTVGLSHLAEIEDMVSRADTLAIKQFLLEDGIADALSSPSDRIRRSSTLFGHDTALQHRVTTGSHTVLWAADMGYHNITLLGIDQNYQEQVDGLSEREGDALEVVEKTNSPNYYFEDYQKVGDRLNRPNPVPDVHATAWRRVIRHVASAFPHVNIDNSSSLSALPGVDAVHEPTVPVSDIRLDGDETWDVALNRILPPRFVEISLPSGLINAQVGPAWKRVAPDRASNEGRWHIGVRTDGADPLNPRLGSLLFLPPEKTIDADWIPASAIYFDQLVRFLSPDGTRTLAVLALRIDDDLPTGTATPRIPVPVARLFWRLVRAFDRVRRHRTAG